MKKRIKTLAVAAWIFAAIGSLIWFSFGPTEATPQAQEPIDLDKTISVLP